MPYLFCLSAQLNIINMTHKEQIIPFRLPFLQFLFILALSVITIVYFAKIDITSLHCKWYYTFFFLFCRVQKHEKVSFGVSDVCRSAKKFHLVFLSCAEARKSFIWCFWRVQKHEKVPFGVSVVYRSMKKFHLVFLSCAEARKSFIWRFWHEQKHEKIPFGVSDASRRIESQFFSSQKVNF